MSRGERESEFTVDELATRAGMTVRNVRAYSTRGLIEPPRLEGRTGYYSNDHLQRLLLIRTLLSRGFTLSAVEESILRSPAAAPGIALDLINIFEMSDDDDPTELMSREELASLAKRATDDPLFDSLAELGLIELVDETTVRLLDPGVVRPGAMTVAMGLRPESIVAIVPHMQSHLEQVAHKVVQHVSADITQPFLDKGLPADEWPQVYESIDALIPIAGQVVAAMFRSVLREAVELEIGLKLEELAADDVEAPPT